MFVWVEVHSAEGRVSQRRLVPLPGACCTVGDLKQVIWKAAHGTANARAALEGTVRLLEANEGGCHSMAFTDMQLQPDSAELALFSLTAGSLLAFFEPGASRSQRLEPLMIPTPSTSSCHASSGALSAAREQVRRRTGVRGRSAQSTPILSCSAKVSSRSSAAARVRMPRGESPVLPQDGVCASSSRLMDTHEASLTAIAGEVDEAEILSQTLALSLAESKAEEARRLADSEADRILVETLGRPRREASPLDVPHAEDSVEQLPPKLSFVGTGLNEALLHRLRDGLSERSQPLPIQQTIPHQVLAPQRPSLLQQPALSQQPLLPQQPALSLQPFPSQLSQPPRLQPSSTQPPLSQPLVRRLPAAEERPYSVGKPSPIPMPMQAAEEGAIVVTPFDTTLLSSSGAKAVLAPSGTQSAAKQPPSPFAAQVPAASLPCAAVPFAEVPYPTELLTGPSPEAASKFSEQEELDRAIAESLKLEDERAHRPMPNEQSIVNIPSDLMGHVIGRKYARLLSLELSSGTKISVPPRDSDSAISFIVIEGPSAGVRKARAELLAEVGRLEKRFATSLSAEVELHVFVDFSNILLGFADTSNVYDIVHTFSVDALVDTVVQRRRADTLCVAGSFPSENARVWEDFKRLKFETHVDPHGGQERFVDEFLHAQILRRVCRPVADGQPSRTLVLLTGDGNDNGGQSNFPECVEIALENKWHVELWSWRRSTSRRFHRIAKARPAQMTIFELDIFREDLVL